MEKAPLHPEEPVLRPESTITFEDSDFESHEDEENVVYTPRSSHGDNGLTDLPPSYDESQAAHAEAQAQARSQVLPGRENLSDVSVYRTEIPPEPNVPRRESSGKEPRAPSPQSGPSILLNQALTFTQELPATDARYAHELTRPIAIPSLPGNVDPMKFARFYATILHHHSVSPAQFMDFIDGLNALSKACSANPAYFRTMEPAATGEPITRATLIPAYLAQTNAHFFAPRGLALHVATLNQLAELVAIPTQHGIRRSMVTDAVRAYVAGAQVRAAANGAATATVHALEPYIEPLSFAVPEPRAATEELYDVAARFATLGLGNDIDTAAQVEGRARRWRPPRRRSIGDAVAGPSARRDGEPGPSNEPSRPFWHPRTLGKFTGDFGERQGRLWGDWGVKQGEMWNKWGDMQNDMWSKWGDQQNEKWSKWGAEFGKKWERWGEDFTRRMSSDARSQNDRSMHSQTAEPDTPATTAVPPTPGQVFGGPPMPGMFPVAHGMLPMPATPAVPPTPEQVPSVPPMPGAFPIAHGMLPIAPGPRGAMIAAMAARGRGAEMAAAAQRRGGGAPFRGAPGAPFGAGPNRGGPLGGDSYGNPGPGPLGGMFGREGPLGPGGPFGGGGSGPSGGVMYRDADPGSGGRGGGGDRGGRGGGFTGASPRGGGWRGGGGRGGFADRSSRGRDDASDDEQYESGRGRHRHGRGHGGWRGGRGGRRGSRRSDDSTDQEKGKEKDDKSDKSDTSTISSTSSSSSSESRSTTVSRETDPDAVFERKASEIERSAAEARKKGKKNEEEIEKERTKALTKADEERSKAIALIERKKLKDMLKEEKKSFKKEWKKKMKVERKTFKKQFKAEMKAWKQERRQRHDHGDRSSNRDDRHDRRRREWESRWEARRLEWELRREKLERRRHVFEQLHNDRRPRRNDRRGGRESFDDSEARDLGTAGRFGYNSMPGAYLDNNQEQGLVREDSNISGGDDILWIVIGNLGS